MLTSVDHGSQNTTALPILLREMDTADPKLREMDTAGPSGWALDRLALDTRQRIVFGIDPDASAKQTRPGALESRRLHKQAGHREERP